MRRTTKALLAAAVVGALAMSLTGCLDNTPISKPTATHTHTHTPSASPTPTPSPTPTASSDPPVTQTCVQLFTAQQAYDYNPNVVANTSYTAASGSFAAQAASENGQACGWINETSNVQLDIAVSEPNATELAAAKAFATANGGLASFDTGGTQNFQIRNGTGVMQVFIGTYWVIISSADFTEVSDAQPVAQTVLTNLGVV